MPEPAQAPSRILVVEDDANIREILRFRLDKEGHQVLTAGSADEALFLVEAPRATARAAAAPCSLFPTSEPITVSDNTLLLGKCPGALFFNGADPALRRLIGRYVSASDLAAGSE